MARRRTQMNTVLIGVQVPADSDLGKWWMSIEGNKSQVLKKALGTLVSRSESEEIRLLRQILSKIGEVPSMEGAKATKTSKVGSITW